MDQIIQNAHGPSDEKSGSVHDVLGYVSPGEISDWVLATFNIPSISPEIGRVMQFYPDTWDQIIESVSEFYPFAEYTMNLLEPKLEYQTDQPILSLGGGKFKFNLKLANTSLTDLTKDSVISFASDVAAIDGAKVKDGFGLVSSSKDQILFTPVLYQDNLELELTGYFKDGHVP